MKKFILLILLSNIIIAAENPLDIFTHIHNEDFNKVIEMIETMDNVNIKDPRFYNDTPLIAIAFKYRNPREILFTISKMLLERGGDPNMLNSFGTNALFLSAKLHKSDKMFLLMKSYNADLSTLYYSSKESLLHVSITNPNKGGSDIFMDLVNSGANIDIQNEAGITPLMLAMSENCKKYEGCGLKKSIIKTLVDRKANLEMTDKYFGFTALKFAIESANEAYSFSYPEIEYLLKHGAIVDKECINFAEDPKLKLLLKKYMLDETKKLEK